MDLNNFFEGITKAVKQYADELAKEQCMANADKNTWMKYGNGS